MHMHMQMHIFISNEYLAFKKHEICKMHPPITLMKVRRLQIMCTLSFIQPSFKNMSYPGFVFARAVVNARL